MNSTVREVRLRLRIAEVDAARAPALRELAERRFLRAVLDAFEAAVHARLGVRAIVRIRRLPLRWKLTGAELADSALQRRLGIELADATIEGLGAQPGGSRPAASSRPRPDANVVMFVDEVHELAAAIADRVEEREPAFYHPAEMLEQLWQLAIARDVVEPVLGWLEAHRLAATALRGAPDEIRVRAARQAGAAGVARPGGRTAPLPIGPGGRLRPSARRIEDPDGPGRSPGSSEASARAKSTSPSPAAAPAAAAGSAIALPCRVVPDHGGASPSVLPATASDFPGELPAIATRAAGAFYLLAQVGELELGEHLWCAGVVEGPAIAHVLARLAAPELRGDPAFAVISGGDEHAELPAWAVDEVCTKVRDSLGRWLAKRGVAIDPASLVRRLDPLAASIAPDPAQRFAAFSAAAIAAVASERLGIDWTDTCVRDLVRRDGHIVREAEAIRVDIPLATVSVELRLAGLDRDPGWVPWLRTTIRIAHVPGDGEAW